MERSRTSWRRASGVRIPLALDQGVLLQRVEDPDELATVEPERVGDRRLGLAGLLAQDLEDAVVVEAEPGLLDLFDRLCLESEAEAREEEGAVLEELLRDTDRRRGCDFRYLSCHVNKCSTPTYALAIVEPFNDREGN